jgi:ribosomal protein S18 acetylase RimI-like enzyme
VLVVDEDHRRQGIGTRLLAEAEAALAKKGCALVEAMSDIEIKNAHNFFRTLKFDQTSYRFARKIAR